MNIYILIAIVIIAIVGIIGVLYVSADCGNKDGSANKVNYKFSFLKMSCVPGGCMAGYGPLTKDGTCPDSLDCSKKDGTPDHVSVFKYDGSKCVPVACLPSYGPLTSNTCPDPCSIINNYLKTQLVDNFWEFSVDASICNPYLKFYMYIDNQDPDLTGFHAVVDKTDSSHLDVSSDDQQSRIYMYRWFIDRINEYNKTNLNPFRSLDYLV